MLITLFMLAFILLLLLSLLLLLLLLLTADIMLTIVLRSAIANDKNASWESASRAKRCLFRSKLEFFKSPSERLEWILKEQLRILFKIENILTYVFF